MTGCHIQWQADVLRRGSAAVWVFPVMIAKLRRVLITARFQRPRPDQATPEEIHAIHLAWETEAA